MAYSLHITQLDRTIKKRILNRQYSINQLEKVHDSLKRDLHEKQKAFYFSTLLCCSIMVVMLVILLVSIGFTPVFYFTLGVCSLLIIFCIVTSWFLTIGILKFQFHRAVKKAYPEYYDLFKL